MLKWALRYSKHSHQPTAAGQARHGLRVDPKRALALLTGGNHRLNSRVYTAWGAFFGVDYLSNNFPSIEIKRSATSIKERAVNGSTPYTSSGI